MVVVSLRFRFRPPFHVPADAVPPIPTSSDLDPFAQSRLNHFVIVSETLGEPSWMLGVKRNGDFGVDLAHNPKQLRGRRVSRSAQSLWTPGERRMTLVVEVESVTLYPRLERLPGPVLFHILRTEGT
jgi:hypothetical protein